MTEIYGFAIGLLAIACAINQLMIDGLRRRLADADVEHAQQERVVAALFRDVLGLAARVRAQDPDPIRTPRKYGQFPD